MGRYKRYSKELKIKVAKEAALPEHERCEHIIADKYGVMPWTVEKWRALYLEYGEMGLSKEFNKAVKDDRVVALEKENANYISRKPTIITTS